MKEIALLHPFTAQAIGLKETDLLTSHSKPHVMALQALVDNDSTFSFAVDYFTGSFFPKKRKISGVLKRFWPVSYPILKRHQWRNQFSASHFRFYKRGAPDVTLINMSGHGSPYIFQLAQWLQLQQKPYIAMLGGMHVSYDGPALTYYQNAHHLLVHTAYQKKQLQEHPHFANLDIRVLPLGIDTAVFKPILNRESKPLVITYVGRISRLKQIELAIEALAYCRKQGLESLQFQLVGPVSDPDYYQELQELAVALDCLDQIQFVGSVSHDELPEYYAKSTILVLPSQHESFGMVMTEAMACGVPVVALKGAGGPDEIITSGEDGLLTTATDYSQAVYELLSNPQKLQDLSMAARKKVLEKFSIQSTITQLQESLNSIFST